MNYTMNISNILNHYIENNYINFDNKITYDEILLLNDTIKARKYKIDVINVPKDFKYMDIIKDIFNDSKINIY